MFFGTYIFAEKHIFFVRPLLEHDVYEKVPCKKHIFFVRLLLEHDVYEKVPYKKYIFFRMHPQRAPKSMFSCRSIFLKMEQDFFFLGTQKILGGAKFHDTERGAPTGNVTPPHKAYLQLKLTIKYNNHKRSLIKA